MSLDERFKHTPGPLMQLSMDIAEDIYKSKGEIDMLAWENGNLYQSEKADAHEWKRLCALIIEEALMSHGQ